MKNYYTCQNKKLVRRKTYSFYLSKSLWCLGRFKSAQFLYLLLICYNMLFWLKYIKMFYSDINRFSSNSGRSSYTTPKLDKLYFLKCYLQSMNFLYAIILKFIDISFNLIRSFTHAWFWNTTHRSFGKYTFSISLYNIKEIISIIIISNLIRKLLKYWEAIKLPGANRSFLKF